MTEQDTLMKSSAEDEGSSSVQAGVHQSWIPLESPVVSQPRHVAQQFQNPQSLVNELALYNFDQSSWSTLQHLESIYQQNDRVTQLVHGGLRSVMATTGNTELPESYDQKYQSLIAGLLLPEERTTCTHFSFGKVVFQHITDAKNGVTVPAKPDITPGRIYLTNKRLILLAIEDTKGLNLTRLDIGKTSRMYTVNGSKNSNFRFESIPLTCIRGVDFSSVYTGSSVTQVKGDIPNGCCQKCCFPFCKKEESWEPTTLVSSSSVNGVVNIGVYLPPWETKCKVMALLPMNGQVTAAVSFIHALQRSSPGLQPDSFSIPRQ